MKSIDFIACHLVGDYILQTDHMAQAKLNDPRVRAEHVLWYSLPFLVVGLLARVGLARLAAFLVFNWIVHFLIDSERWLPNDEWPPGTILNDQALHAVSLAALSRIVR